ncbi:MAG: hypothetical protein JXR26_10135 [Balneolaceae bacterium]|nr:hypothetical protein [Balneolaceae bacterium]
MKPDKLFIELEELVERAGYTIRKERGTFRGDQCIVEGDKLVVINKKRPIEQQVGLLARVLDKDRIKDMYIKPAVRKELETLWRRFEEFDDMEEEIPDNQEA